MNDEDIDERTHTVTTRVGTSFRAERIALTAVAGMVSGLSGCRTVGETPASTVSIPEVTASATTVIDLTPASSSRVGPAIPRRAVYASKEDDPAAPRACCAAMNDCKGKGQCKTALHACKGLNDCKGKGGCRPGECPDRGCCKGMNDCKGLGNCKTDIHGCKGMNDCKGTGGCRAADCS